jgi:hypothetical protein
LHKWGFLRLIFQGSTQLEQQRNTEHTIQCGPIVKSRHFKGTSRSQPLHCWGTFYGRLRAGAIQLITVYKILSRSPGFQTTCSKWFGPHCINQDSKTSPATVWRHNVSCYWRTSSFASGNDDTCVNRQPNVAVAWVPHMLCIRRVLGSNLRTDHQLFIRVFLRPYGYNSGIKDCRPGWLAGSNLDSGKVQRQFNSIRALLATLSVRQLNDSLNWGSGHRRRCFIVHRENTAAWSCLL